MQLGLAQKKIIENKHLGYSLVKGDKHSGKTTTAVYRSLYLKNNYCLYDDDKILILSKDTDLDYTNQMFERAKNETKLDYMTLFSCKKDKLSIETIGDIFYRYFLSYKNSSGLNVELINSEEQKYIIVKQCIVDIGKQYKNIKALNVENIQFFIDEIKWIKSCNYMKIDEYQSADRIGRRVGKGQGPMRVAKNSMLREAIFRLMLLYNKKLRNNNWVDYEDTVLLALEKAKIENNKFNHIIVDDCQNLTKVQIEFIKVLCKDTYWSIMFISNNSLSNSNGWIVKGRKIKDLELGDKVRNYYLRENYEVNNRNCMEIGEDENSIIEENNYNNLAVIENFEYCDIRHNKRYSFTRDTNSISDVIVKNGNREDEYTKEELKQIAVYSNIAAGEPILINPDVEDEFFIPKYWLKGVKDCFILTVKGDSMINAYFCDGDYVVIRKQSMAQNNDIVAVNIDGSATLKRLKIGKSEIILMPENKKYTPIIINEEGASIIGVAVGIIKRK